MSSTIHGKIEVALFGEEQTFNLAPIKCILELEDKCGAGIAQIAARLRDSQYRANDIRETIRLGWVGAGLSDAEIVAKTKRWIDTTPLEAMRNAAFLIIMAVLVGVPRDNDFLKKNDEADLTTDVPTTGASADRTSTGPALQ